VPLKAASGAKQIPVAACERGIHLTLHLAPQTCVADAVKQAESLAAENVELRRMGEDALLDKCALRCLLAVLTIADHRLGLYSSRIAASRQCPLHFRHTFDCAVLWRTPGLDHVICEAISAVRDYARSVCHD